MAHYSREHVLACLAHERNLIFDPVNGEKYAGMKLKGKCTPINSKSIRTMTPSEWGRLQGFIGYAFVDEDGNDNFSFPKDVTNIQKFKQFGNSVTIPVVEEFAAFIQECCELMYQQFSQTEKRIFSMYGNEFLLCNLIYNKLKKTLREKTLNRFFDVVYHFAQAEFRVKELAAYMDVSVARASQIVTQLSNINCVYQRPNGSYCFTDLLSYSK